MECKVSDLVKRGHDKAAQLKSSGGAVSQLISDLATQLDVQLARSNALAAENAGLKAEHELALQYMDELRANFNMYKKFKCQSQSDVTTPATDAFLAEVRAQGVEMFAKKCSEKSKHAISSDTRDSWWLCGEHAGDFAAQLRKGVQS